MNTKSFFLSAALIVGCALNLTVPVLAQKAPELTRKNLDPQRKKELEKVLRESTNQITMVENRGQMPSSVLYSMTTNFGGLYVEKERLTLIALKGVLTDPKDPSQGISHYERQTVHVTFEGASLPLKATGTRQSPATFNFWTDEGQASHVPGFGEVEVQDIYPGVSLRLYSQQNGQLEFDWIVNSAEDYKKIRMHMEGQEGIELSEAGGFRLKSRFESLAFDVPESYQVINGEKVPVKMKYAKADDKTVVFETADQIVAGQPLVIDPTVLWATFFDGYAACDSYLFATVSDPCNQVYCAGRTKASINSIYFGGGTAGYDNSFNTGTECCILYTFAADGKTIVYYTYFGNSLTPADMDRFDNGRIIVVGMRAGKNGGGGPGTIPTTGVVGTAWSNNTNLEGWVAIFSADLATCYYASGLPGAYKLPSDKQGMGVTTVKCPNDSTYIVSGISTNITATNYPLANVYGGGNGPFVPGSAPDPTFGGTYEGYIATFSGVLSNASHTDDYNQKMWATWVGGTADEYFLSFDTDTGYTRVAFTGNFKGATLTTVNGTQRAVGFPALKYPVDSAASVDEGFVGLLNYSITAPTRFEMLSYLGGSLHEDDELCVVNDPYIYVLCNSQSSDFPGTTVPGVYDPSYNGSGTQWKKGDAVISRVPLVGNSRFSDFRSTYFGGKQDDFSGGIIYNHKDQNLYTFITTGSLTSMQSAGADNFPVKNTVPPSNFYDSAKDVAGGTGAQNLDMNFATFSNDLTRLIYSTYCGGSQRDYLGQTGSLIGSGHYDFNHETGIYTLGTTVHSYDFNVPGESGPTPGIISPQAFDGTHGSNATGTYGTVGSTGDQHFITMFNLASQDMGDAPLSYEGGNPAKHGSNTFSTVAARFGANPTDYEPNPLSSTFANGDDLLNSGNSSCAGGPGTDGDDEDAIATTPPIISVESTGNFDLAIKAVNNTGSTANIYAWIDFNGDGKFQSNEAATPFGAFAVDTIRSLPNMVPRNKTIRFNLGSGKACPTEIKSGRTYLRLRMTTSTLTDSVSTSGVDERSHGVANNGEIEDHMIYIRGRDYGDFNASYPSASAMVFADPNEDGIPDSLGAVWAGNYVDIEKDCAPNQSPTALGDDNEGVVDDEDGLTFPAGPIAANTAYTFPLQLNRNVPGTTVYYGVWFDWDADGDFTSPQDDFVGGSSTGTSVNINVTSAPGGNFSPKFGVRVIVSASSLASTDYAAVITNGEVEDYQNDPGLIVSGTVYDDGDGIKDNAVDGTPINEPSATPLYAYLIDGGGLVVDRAQVNVNGTYYLTGGAASTAYEVQISTTFANIGASAPSSANLPADWESVVEQYGTNNSYSSGIEPQPANTPNSRTFVTFNTSDITNVDFGIDKRPTSDDKNASPQPNPGGSVQYVVPALTGGDFEQGFMSTGKTIVIKTLPSNADLYYNGSLISSLPSGGLVIVSYNPAALKTDPTFSGVGTVQFEYVFRDYAFLEDLTNATVTMPFTDPTILISGTVLHDLNGVFGGSSIDGTPFNNPSGVQLYAYLLDSATGLVVDSQYVLPNGNYTLTGVIYSAYEVVVGKNQYAIGASPVVNLPSGWLYVGENYGLLNQIGVGIEPGTPNGRVYVHTGNANVNEVDFGLERTNLAHNKTYLVNPDSLRNITGVPLGGFIRWIRLNHATGTNDTTFNTGNVADKPGRLSGYDPEDKRYNGVNATIGAKMVLNTLPDTVNALLEYKGIKLWPDPQPGNPALVFWNPLQNRYEIDSFDSDSFVMYLKFNYQNFTQFQYGYYDAAGIMGAMALYTLNYTVPLPVKLVSFTGSLNGRHANLVWTVFDEENTTEYKIYRKYEKEVLWSAVGAQPAAGSSAYYQYRHADDLTGMPDGLYLYQLRVIEKNGTVNPAGVVTMRLYSAADNPILIAPNPAADQFHVLVNGGLDENTTMDVMDAMGKSVLKVKLDNNNTTIDTRSLADGVYYIRVTATSVYFSQKLVIRHN
ncbi:MAG: T9SS type A sorting domain-containing protein [Bacteroidetes bacterium]|nr:T9SS type A sorting domain-containing protein [Bacteroidota bacterium]